MGPFAIVRRVGCVVTGIYVIGPIERRDPAVWGEGLDTLAVVAACAGDLALIHALR